METPDFERGRVHFKDFGAERVETRPKLSSERSYKQTYAKRTKYFRPISIISG